MLKIISVQQACKILAEHGFSVSPTHLGLGLQQGVYPFGVAIKSQQWIYEIYDVLLRKWIAERSDNYES